MRWVAVVIGAVVVLVAIVGIGGLVLPQAHTASVRIALRQPVDRVFAAIADIPGQTAWRSGIRSIEVLSAEDEPLRWKETSDFGTIVMRVEEASPPNLFVGRIDDPEQPFGGRWIYRIEPAGDASTLTITEEGEVYNPFFRFMSRFIFGHHRTLEAYARDLARYLGDTAHPERVAAMH